MRQNTVCRQSKLADVTFLSAFKCYLINVSLKLSRELQNLLGVPNFVLAQICLYGLLEFTVNDKVR